MISKQEQAKRMVENLNLCNEILDGVCKNAEEAIQILAKSGIEREMKLLFCLAMLERLRNGTEGVRTLFAQYVANHRKYDFSIGIVLRSMLLDYMIMLNVLEILDRDGLDDEARLAELDNFCLRMLSDSAIHSLNYFEANVDSIPAERLKTMYEAVYQHHPYCFEPYAFDGTKPKLKVQKSFSQKELVNRLKCSMKYKHLSRKEHWYIYYSKYDHFGSMYYSLSWQDLPDQFEHMTIALRELPRSLVLIVAFLTILLPDHESFRKHLEKCTILPLKIDDIENEEMNSANGI
jgi:hypothetical protein